MTIKNFVSDNPGWFHTYNQDVYGGQELRVGPGYEMLEFITWWREWGEIMKNTHPSVQDALMQVKTLHTLSKPQTP